MDEQEPPKIDLFVTNETLCARDGFISEHALRGPFEPLDARSFPDPGADPINFSHTLRENAFARRSLAGTLASDGNHHLSRSQGSIKKKVPH